MRELLRRCRYVLRHGWTAADVREELEFHRAMKERELEAQGLTPAEARDGARRALGNDLAARERARDVWVAPWLQDIVQDLRFAIRLVFRDRGFAAVAIVALGLGIGVNNTLFSILNAFCIRGLPIDSPERVVHVASRDRAGRDFGVSYQDFQDLNASPRSVREFAAFAAAPAALRDAALGAERVQAAYVSAGMFGLMGERPSLGRGFRREDDTTGAPPAVVIAGSIWRGRYGSDPDVIGRTVFVNGAPATVIGVMREGFGFPNNAEVWLPLALLSGLQNRPRSARTLGVVGRLHDGVAIAEARAEIQAIGQRLAAEHRATNEGVSLTAVPINERFMGRLTDPAWLAFIAAGGLVVMIACANVANLLLSRSLARAREIAIRASLGATRRRVVRQLLVESAVLALCGGVLGFGLSLVGLQLIARAIPAVARPYWLNFSMDGLAFTVLAAVCGATVLVSGLVPALHVSRTDVAEMIRNGGRTVTSGVRAHRWTTVFLITEFALTLVLLSGVGEVVRRFVETRRADRVFDPAPLLTMMLSLPADRYPTASQRMAFYDAFAERLQGVGAISSAAIATSLPVGGAPMRDVAVEGRASTDTQNPPAARTVIISDEYFKALGIGLTSGRAFAAPDGTPGHERAIVNLRFADIHFAGQDPIGRRIRLGAPSGAPPLPWMTIVGVSPIVRQRPQLPPEPVVYLPHRSEPPATFALIARVGSSPAQVTSRVREELRRLDPELPVYRILPMEQAISESAWNARVSAWLITILAMISVCLSIVGLYAVTSHAVVQRTQELGVRVALGARPAEIRWLVLRRALWQLARGVAAGVLCTWAWGRLFGSTGFATPMNVLAVTVFLAIVAVVACLVPASRAAGLDPVVALRAD